MDVSALTRQLSRSVAAVATAAATSTTGEGTADAGQREATSTSTSFSDHHRHVDVTRAVAERVVANIDKPKSAEAAPASSELWIPTWVRAAYAARARRGWFLPPPAALAGYADEDQKAEAEAAS